MIANILTILATLALAQATKPFEGVDPNTLSCDPEGQEFLLLPTYDDCSKFFMCTNGEEVLFSCSGGLIFDFELQGCNWEYDAKCILRSDGEDIEGSGSGDDSLEWTEEGSGDEEETPTVAEQQVYFSHAILKCDSAADATRQVVYKGDCQRYWRCVNGVPQTLYCSDGLFFNEKSQQCDFEANVRCNVEVEDELAGEYLVVQ